MRRALSLTLLLALMGAAPAAAAWTPIGGVLNANPADTAAPTSLTGIGGIPHTAWSEASTSQVRVARWNLATGGWVHLGTGSNPLLPTSTSSTDGALAEVGGEPWIAFVDRPGGFQFARVARWNGASWGLAGGGAALNSNSAAGVQVSKPQLSVAGDGTPHLAWIENGEIFVRRFINGFWSGIAQASLRRTGGAAQVTDLEMKTIGGVAHLAWLEFSTDPTGYRIFVSRFNSSSGLWESYGPAATPVNPDTATGIGDISLAGLGGDPHVLWSQGNGDVRVAHLVGPSWLQVGPALNTTAISQAVSVSLTSQGSTLMAAWSQNEGTTIQIRVKRLDSATSTWSEVPAAGAANPINTTSSGAARSVRIAQVAGVPYVVRGEAPEVGASTPVIRAGRLDPSFGRADSAFSATPTTATVRSDIDVFGVEFPLVARFGVNGAFDRVTAPIVFSGPSQTSLEITGLEPATTYTWRVEVSDGAQTSVASPQVGTFTTAPVAQATPTPTPQPTPTPVLQQAAVGATTRGTVLIKLPGSRVFVPLGRAVLRLPIGTDVDTRKGRVLLRFAIPGGHEQSAIFYGGRFKIASQAADGLARMRLQGRLTRCASARTSATLASAAAKRKKKKPLRRLWGDGKGKFQTSGRYAAAVVRGTKWLTEDFCDSTRVTVRRGRVDVRDRVRAKTVRVRAGRSYTARARRR